MNRLRTLVGALLLSFSFALFSWYFSVQQVDRFSLRPVKVQVQYNTLVRGDCCGEIMVPAPWKNRILFPLAFVSVSRAFPQFSPSQWFLLLRFLLLWAFYACFYLLLRRMSGGSFRTLLFGLGLCAYMLTFALIKDEVSSDLLDACFFLFFFWGVSRMRRWAVFLGVILAAANRESNAFVGVLWLLVHGFDSQGKFVKREGAFALLLSVTGYLLVTALRTYFLAGENPDLQWFIGLACIRDFIMPVFRAPVSLLSLPSYILFALFFPVSAWIYHNRSLMRGSDVRLVQGAALIAGLSVLTSGSIAEPRVFIPTLVVLAATATMLEGRRHAVR
jgi:hypothetical protein